MVFFAPVMIFTLYIHNGYIDYSVHDQLQWMTGCDRGEDIIARNYTLLEVRVWSSGNPFRGLINLRVQGAVEFSVGEEGGLVSEVKITI
jgi:hypothetical protein